MRIFSVLKSNGLVIKVQGELDMVSAKKFRQGMEQCMVKYPVKNVILDLHDVDFIDSSGLGVILGRYKTLRGRGGKLSIINAKPQVYKILNLSGVSKLTPVYENEREALEK